MDKKRFYICKHCGNLIGLVVSAGVPMKCCGEDMKELIPNTVDAATEKHLPAINVDGDVITATVGSTAHPMTEEHYITFIYLETERGGQRKALSPGEEPVAKFSIIDDKPIAVYAYCNLHSLWKTDL